MKKFCFILLFGISCLNVFSQGKNSILPLFQRLQAVLEKNAAFYSCKGISASIGYKNNVMWNGTFGYSHGSVKIDTNTLFGIGSNTKTYTATIILQLYQEGKLKLKDPIYKYLKRYKNIDSLITIEQLLNHTSGIYDFTNNSAIWNEMQNDTGRIWLPGDQLKYVLTPDFEAGTSWRYSNTNYILLGMIIEYITGNKYVSELHKRILEPLHLKDTYFHPFDTLKNKISDVWSYTNNTHGNVTLLNNCAASFTIAHSAGAIVSTASDFAKFLYSLHSGQLLADTTLRIMKTGCTKNPDYGLGIFINNINRNGTYHKIYGHGGFIGYSTTGFYIPSDSLSIIVLCNQNTEVAGFMQGLYAAYLNEPPTDLSISNDTIADITIASSVVGQFSTTDPNKHSNYTYSLAVGDGLNDADNACFEISGNKLLTKCTFNYNVKSQYAIYVKSNDGLGGEVNKPFKIVISKSTSINENEVNIANIIYPNPSQGVFTIQLDDKIPADCPIIVEIKNIDGKLILFSSYKKIAAKQFDLSDNPKGIYIINLKIGEQIINRKLCLNNL